MIYPTSESVEAMQKCINDVQGNKNVENKLKINDDKIEFMNTPATCQTIDRSSLHRQSIVTPQPFLSNPSHFTMTPINV